MDTLWIDVEMLRKFWKHDKERMGKRDYSENVIIEQFDYSNSLSLTLLRSNSITPNQKN